MSLRIFLITTLSTCAALLAPASPVLAQDAPQCTLEGITNALNQLECTVSGTFVSPASLVQAITTTCQQAADQVTCRACFRKSGGKAGPALKSLVKLKLLPKSALGEFRIAIVTAEEATCSAKEGSDDEDENEDESELQRPERPQSPGFESPRSDDQGRGRGRGRGQGRGSPNTPGDDTRLDRTQRSRPF